MSEAVFENIRLEGASNFRDIGGCVTADGRRMKRGLVFRSGELSHLTDADLDLLRNLRVALVVDLRSLAEHGVHRSRWPTDIDTEQHQADITMDIRVGGRPILELITSDPAHVTDAVAESFAVIAGLCGPALRLITERLANGIEPVLFHCTNGRDRTGVIAAMLLHMLGMSRDVIVADFLMTNERINVELVIQNSIDTLNKALGAAVDYETVKRITLVQAVYIDTMFRGFDEAYGSAENYLRHFGIDEAMVIKLRQRLLQPA